jgi:hypothetical protein
MCPRTINKRRILRSTLPTRGEFAAITTERSLFGRAEVVVGKENAMSLDQAKNGLTENVRKHLAKDKNPILWNQNVALLQICDSLERLERDVALLHQKLQPALKAIVGDQHDWQQRTRGDRTAIRFLLAML